MRFGSTGKKAALWFALTALVMVPAFAQAHGDDHAAKHETEAKVDAAEAKAKAALTRTEALAKEAEMKAAAKAKAAAAKTKKAAKGAAEDLGHVKENVKESEEILKKTYREDRAKGEGVVEASGDAYEAVLEKGNERAAEKKKKKMEK